MMRSSSATRRNLVLESFTHIIVRGMVLCALLNLGSRTQVGLGAHDSTVLLNYCTAVAALHRG